MYGYVDESSDSDESDTGQWNKDDIIAIDYEDDSYDDYGFDSDSD